MTTLEFHAELVKMAFHGILIGAAVGAVIGWRLRAMWSRRTGKGEA